MTVRIGIIGDRNADAAPHAATERALGHAGDELSQEIEFRWLPTVSLLESPASRLAWFDGLWCTTGSPYRSLQGALNGIRFARESRHPFLGTCAGFQHAVLEYARNVLGRADAQHAEYGLQEGHSIVVPLACSLDGRKLEVRLAPGSRVAACYGATTVEEEHHCDYGLNRDDRLALHEGGLRIVGSDELGEARIVELAGHPFFAATLFVPQARSTPGRPHPLVMAFVTAALAASERTGGSGAEAGV